MSSILGSQGVVLATAMAVSGTVILLALRLQKAVPTAQFSVGQTQILRSCISSEENKKRRNHNKQKRVHFAEDVIDPRSDGDEAALYNGILRDRVVHRVAYSF
uniref:Uncharacterized protein n=1 Tax=Cannabis sativa TaxID=3483 RepID=A0A803QBM1_CANSA